MANLRNPLLKSTGALVSGTPVLNVEKCLGVQKIGTTSLLFIFDYDKVERNVIWDYALEATRDAEYALLVTTSTLWAAGTNKAFVSSSAATVVPSTGVATVSEDAINLNAFTTVSKDAKVNFLGTGGATIYSIVFATSALDGIKTVSWDYTSDTDRDNVYAEITASTNAGVFFSEGASTGVNAGTAATGSTAVEEGDNVNHVTTLTIDTTLGAIAGGANLALGKLLYTFPAGAVVVKSAKLRVALTALDGNIDADTPDIGLGTVIASGAVAVLGGTTTFEDILTGQTAADCSGTATVKTVATTKVIETADAHTVYLNVADGWAAGGEAALPVTGTVTIEWTLLG